MSDCIHYEVCGTCDVEPDDCGEFVRKPVSPWSGRGIEEWLLNGSAVQNAAN